MEPRPKSNYLALIIIVLVSVGLLLFSFWLIHRRTNLPRPETQPAAVDNQPVYNWTDFADLTTGVKFQYPNNLFIANPKPTQAGSIHRIFLATGAGGTISVDVSDQQFERPADSSAIGLGNQVGYQFQETVSGCVKKSVAAALGTQTVTFAFASCDYDSEPKLVTNQDLILQILASVKLNPNTAQLPAIENINLTADDTGASGNPVTVQKDDIVELTFTVSNSNVTSGGLRFKSANIDTGSIFAGSSKTISFKADQALEFAVSGLDGVVKNYSIKINVQANP